VNNNLIKIILESNIINFTFVFIFLTYALVKFLPKSTKERQAQLELMIEEANKSRILAEQKLSELENEIKKAKLDAQSIIETANASAENLKRQIINSAQQEIERLNSNALKEIDLQKSLAINQIRSEIVSKAFELTEANLRNKKDEINKLIQARVKEELLVRK
jgi:F-type H+-transporting ATPase subunit b